MPGIHIAALFGLLLAVCCYQGFQLAKNKNKNDGAIACLLFATALLLRLAAATQLEGFGSDLACFAAWAERMHEVGPSRFYSPEVFADYPPGYLYVLWIIGWLRSALDISWYSPLHVTLLKLPAILCDLACGLLLYRESVKRSSGTQALSISAAYLFNPVILLNSAVWGQVDSVFTLALLLMCLSLVKERPFSACAAFCAGLLLKPQMLLFFPILLAGMVDQVILRDFSLRRLGKHLLYVLFSLTGFLGLCLPFGIGSVWKQYFSTVGSYPYAAVNACNFWGLLGLNWVSQDTVFLGIPCRLYGFLFILAAVMIVLALSLRHRDNREKYPFLAAVLILTLFTFSVRMHERYLYPALSLLLLALIYRSVKEVWICYGGFSLLHFYNTAFVLFFYDPEHYDRKAPFLLLVSAGMLLAVFFLYRFTIPEYFSRQQGSHISSETLSDQIHGGILPAQNASLNAFFGSRVPRPSRRALPLGFPDLFWMAAVTLVYSCFALYDLGDTAAPESRYDMTYGDSVMVSFENNGEEASSIAYYMAPGHNRNFLVETNGEEGSDPQAVTFDNVFTWQEISLDTPGTVIRLTLTDDSASLLELVFLNREGHVMTPANASDYPALFDEQSLYPDRFSFRNSMYFDEIYHGRTAYEFLNGLVTYETTHPPLGKIFIAAGIALFGMNPFGWRIAGTFFGILMVPVLYLFGKRLTESTPAAALACVLFAFDFMHFTQTRIATIDVYITFFVLLMYFFMFCYCKTSFYDTPLSRTFLPLGACGVCMGFGIACKWTGVYAGAGLAVLFFAILLRRYQEYLYAKAAPTGESSGISHEYILRVFRPHTIRTLCFCLLFFVAVPALIYLLSYLPFINAGGEGLFARMLHNQTAMYRYHSTLDATHPYSSPWYEWPVIRRPIWYYSSVLSGNPGSGGHREGISAFGNPLVWWPGIPASLYMLRLWTKKKDRTASFLLIGYLAQYLPWFFVTRITFIYHYFPSVAFVTLMIVYSLLQMNSSRRMTFSPARPRVALPHQRQKTSVRPCDKKELSARKFLTLTVLYGSAAFLLFLLFYPVLSGQPVDSAYVDRWLRWFHSWVLTAP